VLQRAAAEDRLTLQVGKKRYEIAAGSWSGWIPVTFRMRYFTSARGMVRFYVKSVRPDVELYMSPVNFDPEHPAFPVSWPGSFSRTLSRAIGRYHTLGQAGDTWALNQGLVSEQTALEQYDQALSEDTKILFHELPRFKKGVFFFYFGIPDTVQHMFLANPGALVGGKDPVRWVYGRMDSVVGKVMDSLDKDTTLIILSDHGFSAFRRVVHLNSWLEQNGYLVLKQGERPSDLLFENVDWDRTRAYALGLSGIYVNQRGREAHGIVAPGQETDDLLREITGKLEAVTDPASGARAVSKVYRSSMVYHGPRAAAAPDLVVGFFPGWRVSWQTALGGVPGQVFDDNARRWNADHIFDAAHIPGILLMNRKIAAAHPRIIDIAPTILKLLHLRIPDDMDGTPLLQE
jgi:hypothetical protein